MTQLDTGLIVGAGLLVILGIALVRGVRSQWSKAFIFCGLISVLSFGGIIYVASQAERRVDDMVRGGAWLNILEDFKRNNPVHGEEK